MAECYRLSHDANMRLDAALNQPSYFARVFYESEAWQTAKTRLKNDYDEKNLLIKALNEVIKALNARR